MKKNPEEALRWLETAKDDLDAAQIMLQNNKFSHACFHSQQSAEKVIKAVHFFCNSDPWGHSIVKLISELEELAPSQFALLSKFNNRARLLDRFYIPTRYPDGLPDITPREAFGLEEAESAIEAASLFLEIGKNIIQE